MSLLETNQPKAATSGLTRWLIVAIVVGLLVLGVAFALRAGESGAITPASIVPVATATVAVPATVAAPAAPVTSSAPAATVISAPASPTATSDQTSNMGYLDQLTHEQDFCNCGH